MAETNGLSAETEAALEQIGKADIVVGIPTFNNADTIRTVVGAARAGLDRSFPSLRGVLINADGGSTDGTPEIFREAGGDKGGLLCAAYPIYPIYRLSTPYHGMPGRDAALRTIFQFAQRLGAKVCAVLDSDASGIMPDWIPKLVAPVLEDDFDFVAPYYVRHKFDGTITSGIIYPLNRALYGRGVRQPMGSEGAFSSRLLEHCLSQDVWEGEVGQSGIDMWLTTQAISGDFQLCQVFLGTKGRSSGAPSSDLSAILAEVIGALFSEMQNQASVWQKIRGSRDVPLFGRTAPPATPPVEINVGQMLERFRKALGALEEIWTLILSPAALVEIKKAARVPDPEFRIRDELWVRIVFDFAIGYKERVIRREQLFQALTPLYLAWVASFVQQVADAEQEAVEERLENLCVAFETHKPYLISRWRWPDRFNP